MSDPFVAPGPLRSLVARLAEAHGAVPAEAALLAQNLVWNDMAGRRNHGVERLPVLLSRLAAGGIISPAPLAETRAGPGLIRLDAEGGLGQVAGARGVDLGVAAARRLGLAAVIVGGSHFYGTGAWFLDRAAGQGMICLALSNSYAKVAPPGGARPALGTNPLSFGAPRPGGPPLMVDFSTAALAGSTLRAAMAAGEALPEGLAVDAEGLPVTDPTAAPGATLLPAAGAKGFGLALMVEWLTGLLAGGAVPGSLYGDPARPNDSAHFFLLIDPERLLPGAAYAQAVGALEARLAAADPAARLPGAARAAALARAQSEGIALPPDHRAALTRLAQAAGLAAADLPWPG